MQHSLFRFSTFLCLVLSTACLGIAEAAEMPSTVPFFLLIGILLVAEYFNNERWLLPIWASNLLALAIIAGWAVWFALGAGGSEEEVLAQLLPRAGPLLGTLLVAKLLRPKAANDYWMLHLLGLVQVVLASVLALQSRVDRRDPLFVLVLAAYVFALVWSLMHFARQREEDGVAAWSRTRAKDGIASPVVWREGGGGRRPEILSALRWFVFAGVLGLLIFFAVPRPGMDLSATLMLAGSPRAQTGFSPGLDLNETTPIEVSEEEVMRVEVTDADGRRLMLDCDGQRWRGVTCSVYQRGRWGPIRAGESQNLQSRVEPELRGGEVFVTFFLDVSRIQTAWYAGEDERPWNLLERTTTQPIFLAEPVIAQERTLPIISFENPRDRFSSILTYRPREWTISVPTARRSRRLAYTQVFDLSQAGHGEWSQPTSFPLHQPVSRDYWDSLLALPLPAEDLRALTNTTREILRAANIDPNVDDSRLSGQERRERRIAIARALTNRLNQSADFDYTLERPRHDMARDPTVDFLLNTKAGHCGMYASALALMLRTQKIPSRVVIGFRGARWYSVGEYHSVCQYHAHAWVEAFIEDADSPPIPPRLVPNTVTGKVPQSDAPKPVTGRWLTLDPTPGGGTAAVAGFSAVELWRDFVGFIRYLWEFFILEYSGDVQQNRILAQIRALFDPRELAALWNSLTLLVERATWIRIVIGGLVLAVILALGKLARRLVKGWRTRSRQNVVPGFFGELLRILGRVGLRPEPAETPAEFAEKAATWLGRSPGTASVRDVPSLVVQDYYAVRYGQKELSPEESAQLRERLGQLRSALANR
ncbi:MAG: transglutaminaseTgpA domain-containing protein [Gemmatales bacterium]|nr:transglutaminaseTgpA domain-containing protein [Gemmatales bacterium]MDW8386682.1 transglutaminaseTgpA domain-containing protein [Gemmatales bacterium]